MLTDLLFVHALSPLHAGTGQGVDVIDLPIAREKATGIPYLPGSSIKGVLRDACQSTVRNVVFGPEAGVNASEHAGAAHFSDARLVLLPVRSAAGTFAYVTSPYLLERLARDAADAGLGNNFPKTKPSKTECFVYENTTLKIQIGKDAKEQRVVLEDLDLTPQNVPSATDTQVPSWNQWLDEHIFPGIGERLCIVHDDVMSYLLKTATEVVARIRLNNETKIVEAGALWYEESLPTESVLVSLLMCGKGRSNKHAMEAVEVHKTLMDLTDKARQFGGKATVGRGLCRLYLKSGRSKS
jgi:CRISPR-associated protein Cmr4